MDILTNNNLELMSSVTNLLIKQNIYPLFLSGNPEILYYHIPKDNEECTREKTERSFKLLVTFTQGATSFELHYTWASSS